MTFRSFGRMAVAFAASQALTMPAFAAAFVDGGRIASSTVGDLSGLPLLPAPWAAPPASDESYELAFEAGNTTAIVKALNDVRGECASVPSEYRIDCLAKGLKWAAGRISAPDYAVANNVLRQTAAKLERIVASNVDPEEPPLEAKKSNRSWKAPRKYRAVRRASLSAANAEARKVIEEGVKELMRAVESSAKRRNHYDKIAAALDSTKTLLRSS